MFIKTFYNKHDQKVLGYFLFIKELILIGWESTDENQYHPPNHGTTTEMELGNGWNCWNDIQKQYILRRILSAYNLSIDSDWPHQNFECIQLIHRFCLVSSEFLNVLGMKCKHKYIHYLECFETRHNVDDVFNLHSV